MPREPAHPTAPYPPARGRRVRTDRLGFVVDVVGYGQRTEQAQQRLGDRLRALLRQVVTDLGDAVDEVDHDNGTGDGTVVCLPSHGDPTGLLPAVLFSAATRLAADNAANGDRIRLRMAVGSGPADRFTGPLVTNISRLVDSEPLRRVADTNLDADLVVLVLDTAKGDLAPGYLPVAADRVQLVDLAMRESPRRAWLWVSTPQGR
ncbi:hypothetical protein [Actinophytocola glycyrrhizae]|uniref:Guanylate cyclase domain-containing protein n=1 Tax=Actinophytocola glycyrrhizae TaxID=2044873 RepID=A0ABV9SCH3_9PSEU